MSSSFLTLDIAFKTLKSGDIASISVNGAQKSQLSAKEAGACHKIPQFQAVLKLSKCFAYLHDNIASNLHVPVKYGLINLSKLFFVFIKPFCLRYVYDMFQKELSKLICGL